MNVSPSVRLQKHQPSTSPTTRQARTPADDSAAMPYTPPTRPNANPRFSGGNVVPNSAVATGTMPPPPTACTARAANSIQKLPTSCANPHRSDPPPNSRMLARYTYLRPERSASLPITGMAAA